MDLEALIGHLFFSCELKGLSFPVLLKSHADSSLVLTLMYKTDPDLEPGAKK